MSQSTRSRQTANVNDFQVWRNEFETAAVGPWNDPTFLTIALGQQNIYTVNFTLYEASCVRLWWKGSAYSIDATVGMVELGINVAGITWDYAWATGYAAGGWAVGNTAVAHVTFSTLPGASTGTTYTAIFTAKAYFQTMKLCFYTPQIDIGRA